MTKEDFLLPTLGPKLEAARDEVGAAHRTCSWSVGKSDVLQFHSFDSRCLYTHHAQVACCIPSCSVCCTKGFVVSCRQVRFGRGWYLFRGVPVQRYSQRESALAYWYAN